MQLVGLTVGADSRRCTAHRESRVAHHRHGGARWIWAERAALRVAELAVQWDTHAKTVDASEAANSTNATDTTKSSGAAERALT